MKGKEKNKYYLDSISKPNDPSLGASQQATHIVLTRTLFLRNGRRPLLLLLRKRASPTAAGQTTCLPPILGITSTGLVAVYLLDSDPGNGNDNVHALGVGSLPLVCVRSILFVVPEGADSAVHAAAALLLNVGRRGAVVLDDGAVGNVLVGGLRGGVGGG